MEENDKNPLDWLSWSEKERKSLKSFWNSEEHVKEKLFKRLNFQISIDWKIDSIDRAPIESGKFKPKFVTHFWSVEKYIRSIENLENWNFWKTKEVLCKNHSNQFINVKCMIMSLKVFQKHLNSIQIFQKQDFLHFSFPKLSQETYFISKIKKLITLDGQTNFTYTFMY